jgi:hypothetical protein
LSVSVTSDKWDLERLLGNRELPTGRFANDDTRHPPHPTAF